MWFSRQEPRTRRRQHRPFGPLSGRIGRSGLLVTAALPLKLPWSSATTRSSAWLRFPHSPRGHVQPSSAALGAPSATAGLQIALGDPARASAAAEQPCCCDKPLLRRSQEDNGSYYKQGNADGDQALDAGYGSAGSSKVLSGFETNPFFFANSLTFFFGEHHALFRRRRQTRCSV